MNPTKKINYSDWFGVAASALCTIHCALSPLFFVTKPVFASTFGAQAHSHGAWASLDYVFLVMSLLAVWYSSEHTNDSTISWMLWASWFVFAIGLFFEPLELSFGKFLMYVGSILLVIAHIKNYRHCQHCAIEAKH